MSSLRAAGEVGSPTRGHGFRGDLFCGGSTHGDESLCGFYKVSILICEVSRSIFKKFLNPIYQRCWISNPAFPNY